MSLLQMYSEYCAKPESARRSIFEAAMVDRLENGEGYKMSDLLFELCQCQSDLHILKSQVDSLTARISKKASRKPKDAIINE